MANETRSAELTLLARVDQQTIQRSIAKMRELSDQTENLEDASKQAAKGLEQVGGATQKNISGIRQRTAALRLDIDAQQRQLKLLREEEEAREDVAIAATRQARAVSSIPTGRNSADFGRISMGFNSVASVLPGNAGNAVRTVGDLAGIIDDLPRAAEEAKVALAALNVGMSGLLAAGAAGAALIALALVIKQFAKEIEENQKRLGSAFESRLAFEELIRTATLEEIEARRVDLLARKASIEATLDAAEAARQAEEAVGGFYGAVADLANFLGLTVTKEEKAAREELAALNQELGRLNQASQNQAVQNRSAAEEVKKSTEATNAATQAEQARTTAIQATTQALSFSQQVAQQVRDRQQKIADAREQFEKQFEGLELRRLDVIREHEERQTEIIENARRDQAAAYRRLEADIAKMRIRASLDEFEALLNLDFAGVGRIRRQTEFDIGSSRFDAQLDSQERLISTQFALEDARVDTTRQLIQIEEERARIAVESAQAVAKITAESIKAMVASLPRIILGSGGFSGGFSSVGTRAGGGPVEAGQPYWVNDGFRGQREGFGGSMFPPGLGLFIPARSGSVTNNSHAPTYNFNINGANNPHETARIVKAEIAKYDRETYRR